MTPLAPVEAEVRREEVHAGPLDVHVRAKAAARLAAGHRQVVGARRLDGMSRQDRVAVRVASEGPVGPNAAPSRRSRASGSAPSGGPPGSRGPPTSWSPTRSGRASSMTRAMRSGIAPSVGAPHRVDVPAHHLHVAVPASDPVPGESLVSGAAISRAAAPRARPGCARGGAPPPIRRTRPRALRRPSRGRRGTGPRARDRGARRDDRGGSA